MQRQSGREVQDTPVADAENEKGFTSRSSRARREADYDMDDDDGNRSAVGDGEISDEVGEDGEEPRYCYCNGVSYGDMVACDNEKCPIEWFHWNCVGLSAEPKGRWLCPNCSKLPRNQVKFAR